MAMMAQGKQQPVSGLRVLHQRQKSKAAHSAETELATGKKSQEEIFADSMAGIEDEIDDFPIPGETYMLRSLDKIGAIGVHKGELMLVDDAACPLRENPEVHWKCDLFQGWYIFRNVASGLYLQHEAPSSTGQESSVRPICARESLSKDSAQIVPLMNREGGHKLCMMKYPFVQQIAFSKVHTNRFVLRSKAAAIFHIWKLK